MKRLVVISVIVLFTVNSIYSQGLAPGKKEWTLGIGTTNYFGDIGGAAEVSEKKSLFKDLDIGSMRPSFYAGYSYQMSESVSFKSNFHLSILGGNDKGSINEAREYAFNSILFGADVVAQYGFQISRSKSKKYAVMRVRRSTKMKKIGYVFGGVGLNLVKTFPNEPMKSRADSENTEGHEFKLFNFSPTFPLGLGVRFQLKREVWFGIEGGLKFSTSDFLEGFTTVSSSANDMFYFSNFYVTYFFGKKRYRF